MGNGITADDRRWTIDDGVRLTAVRLTVNGVVCWLSSIVGRPSSAVCRPIVDGLSSVDGCRPVNGWKIRRYEAEKIRNGERQTDDDDYDYDYGGRQRRASLCASGVTRWPRDCGGNGYFYHEGHEEHEETTREGQKP